MPETAQDPPQKFDSYADDYRSLVEASIEDSGESAEYFAEYKLACLLRLGAPRGEPVLDFGAGTGSLTECLAREFRDVTAYEPSTRSLTRLREKGVARAAVGAESDLLDGHFSTAVCAGVLHHVPKAERVALLSRLRAKLRPGGRLYVFEHNPLNPLTQRAVRRCAFDDDAVLLWPWELRPMFRRAGFEVERVDYIVFFPRVLAPLRPLEPHLRGLLLGAQTLTVSVNPG